MSKYVCLVVLIALFSGCGEQGVVQNPVVKERPSSPAPADDSKGAAPKKTGGVGDRVSTATPAQ
jgi:hypothetical protein